MVGLSMFFASSFKNVFEAQQNLEGTQGHFVINDIIQDKFANLAGVIGTPSTSVIIQNKVKEGILPFTYIGLNETGSEKHLVFKDFFMFKGMIGSNPSSTYSSFNNPGGIAQVGTNYYITSPLENKIYKCDASKNCSEVSLTWSGDNKLNQPIDITTNAAQDVLYITDSGNNRIVVVTNLGDTSPSASALNITGDINFPVGIDFYNDGTNDYLFFSEPYKNKVYRVKTDGSDLKVVVGEGDDYTCNNSALYCKLDFPTGVYADDATHSLYIADTGKNRVLKVSDPGYPTNISVKFSSPETDEEIRKIIFTFPASTNINLATVSGTIGINSHGELDLLTPGSITYKLWTLLSEGTNTTNPCTPPEGEESCTNPKIKIKVDNSLLFDTLTYNSVNIVGDALNPITITSNESGGVFGTRGFDTGHAAGTEVALMTPIPAITDITFDFSNLDTSTVAGGFQDISIEMFNEGDVSLGTKSDGVRIGNGILGTPEDIITVQESSLNYPTGVYWNGSLQKGEGVTFSANGATFDYTTDFAIDVNGLTFSEPNSGAILQAIIKAGGQEYIINGAIPTPTP